MYRKIVLLGMTLLLGVPMSQAKKEPKSIPPVPLTPQQQRLVQQAIGREKVVVKQIQKSTPWCSPTSRTCARTRSSTRFQ